LCNVTVAGGCRLGVGKSGIRRKATKSIGGRNAPV